MSTFAPNKYVSAYAGTGVVGFKDGPAENARFSGPKEVMVDPDGNVYVADRLNFVLRKIDIEGEVTTVAGSPGISGYLDGEIDENTLIGRAVDVVWYNDKFLLITDLGNHSIRKLTFDSSTTSNIEQLLPVNISISISPNPCF